MLDSHGDAHDGAHGDDRGDRDVHGDVLDTVPDMGTGDNPVRVGEGDTLVLVEEGDTLAQVAEGDILVQVVVADNIGLVEKLDNHLPFCSLTSRKIKMIQILITCVYSRKRVVSCCEEAIFDKNFPGGIRLRNTKDTL